MTSAYESLHPTVKRWVFDQGWKDLRPIQKKTIPYVLKANTDLIISASTAAGKTEAFFLPALSKIANEHGITILHISPLKALINDQYRRLKPLCEKMNIQITPWHGDSAASLKENIKKKPSGVLMITPESLESLLINRTSWVRVAFHNLKYVAIDEFHAFIGQERGYQLTSMLNRLEFILNKFDKPTPRIALSATLGNIYEVPALLRPGGNFPCETLSDVNSQAKLRVNVKGYYAPIKTTTKADDVLDRELCNDLFELCRGGSHLVFASSRQRTETISARLSQLSEGASIPNEFFPHHGSLDKGLRKELETRLQSDSLPTTAICTNTLELGVDIGNVDSVVQITPPMTVSSLKQRTGRSGRRGGPSILRVLITEHTIEKDTHLVDRLRLGLLQTIATLHLLLVDKWFEPASKNNYHFSTLLQQTLALIAQAGSVRADKLYYLLCQTGPFIKVNSDMFISLLKHLGNTGFITQTSDGELTLGKSGEQITSDYRFYAAFVTPDEFTIRAKGKSIGKLPMDSAVSAGQYIVFAGKFWMVENVEFNTNTINVSSSSKGSPPRFGGTSASVSEKVRQKMLQIISSEQHGIKVGEKTFGFLDKSGENLFLEGVAEFNKCDLKEKPFVGYQGALYIFPWSSDQITSTLASILLFEMDSVGIYSGVIEVKGINGDMAKDCFLKFIDEPMDEQELSENTGGKYSGKYDDILPLSLFNLGSGTEFYDVPGTIAWIKKTYKQ